MACADGEEGHLEQLARDIDERIEEFRKSFGEIGDQRLLVMSAVAFADELSEAKRQIARLQAEIAGMDKVRENLEAERDAWAGKVAEALEGAAERMERMAREGK